MFYDYILKKVKPLLDDLKTEIAIKRPHLKKKKILFHMDEER